MKPLLTVILWASLLGKSAAQTLIQSQRSITVAPSKSVHFYCEIQGLDFEKALIHWYRQRPGQEPQRLLYFMNPTNYQKDVPEKRLTVSKVPESKSCKLLLTSVRAEDAGTYFCAYWITSGSWKKIFGQGTQLIVTNKKPSAPTVRLFPPKLQNDKGFVACLVTDFFPNVINVKWKIDDKTLSSNLLEISVNQMEGGTYSTIDHLEVTKVEWEEKTIVCYVEHEAGNEKASTSRKKREEAHTSEVPENPKCPPKDKDLPEIMVEGTSSSSLRVAIFTYTLLLMKSVLYCGIISFIVYKVEYRDTKKPL